ncbi:MAG: hypothetical protein ACI93L_001354 [Cyclobacteriaceae bacterium]|jgi:hypothetical protein
MIEVIQNKNIDAIQILPEYFNYSHWDNLL